MSDLSDIQHLRGMLSFMYRIMLASAPLLDLAMKMSEGELSDYYKIHLAEEEGHEEMVRADLDALGVKIIPDYFAAAELAGSQYYLVAHKHPAALLGYMQVLESHPMPIANIEYLETRHNTHLTAFRHHSEHDPQHCADLAAIIGRQPQPLKELVIWNELYVYEKLVSIMTSLRYENGGLTH